MRKIAIANLDDIDALGARKAYVNGMEVAIFKLSDGTISVMENRCPHKNGKLSEGMVCGQVVHCPLHDWRINVKDGKVQEPDHGCVLTFQTEVDQKSGVIYVLWDEVDRHGLYSAG